MRLALLVLLVGAGVASAQPPDSSTVERGRHFFSNNCGICHGFNAGGGDKGPALNTGQFKHGNTDADLQRSITQGIPGTIMPAINLPADEVRAIIAFLRATVVAAKAPSTGNAEAGEKIFRTSHKCADCHSPVTDHGLP